MASGSHKDCGPIWPGATSQPSLLPPLNTLISQSRPLQKALLGGQAPSSELPNRQGGPIPSLHHSHVLCLVFEFLQILKFFLFLVRPPGVAILPGSWSAHTK